MTVSAIRQELLLARRDGHVEVDEIDRIMLRARDLGGLDDGERAALLEDSNGFDDATRQRLLTHLSSMDQRSAWVNIEAVGQVATIEGRRANMSTGVPGLSARLGMFDNCFSLKGTATEPGTLRMTVEGQAISVEVSRGDTSAAVLQRVKAQLPRQVTGLVLAGEAQPWDPALYSGQAAQAGDTAAHLMLYKPDALHLRPGETPLRVVVTGYGAFMGITDNPSARIAQELAHLGVEGAIVEYRRLDVTTDAVDGFMAEVRRNPPDVILSMGVGGRAQVEERPENFLAAAPDGNNVMMREREIRPRGPRELPTDLPVDTIDWALGRYGDGRVVFTSRSDPTYRPDRSAYLCNYLGYSLASDFRSSDATTAGFMHITPTTPVNQMHSVLKAVVAKQLEWRRARPAS